MDRKVFNPSSVRKPLDRYSHGLPMPPLFVVSGFTRPEFLVEVEVTAAKVF